MTFSSGSALALVKQGRKSIFHHIQAFSARWNLIMIIIAVFLRFTQHCSGCFMARVFVFQMAVSQNTVAAWPAAVGEAEYGGGCFLFQLGKMGILSCLHRFLSGRWRALISRHKTLFFSIISIMVASPHSHGIWTQRTARHQQTHTSLLTANYTETHNVTVIFHTTAGCGRPAGSPSHSYS